MMSNEFQLSEREISDRNQAYHSLQSAGVELLLDIDSVPEYVMVMNRDDQNAFFQNTPPGKFHYESIRFPADKLLTEDFLLKATRFPEIERLFIKNQNISDKLILELGSFFRLEVLVLSGCIFSEHSISLFPDLPEMSGLDVFDTSFSSKSIELLKAKYPQATVYHNGMN